jgi:ceramide glucosyltransferase
MYREAALALWSVAGVAWWLIAWRLVTVDQRRKSTPVVPRSRRSLTIFKPLPPLGARGLEAVRPGLESFVAQMDPCCDMLVGAHEADRATVEPFIEAVRARYPKAQVQTIFRAQPDAVANPKIAWQMHLAPYATGELWMWSDADIVVPPQFLQAARDEFAKCGAAMLTFPYVMRRAPKRSALFEEFFVNADFYPGVVFLRRFGMVDFGLGAAMLFEGEEFRKRIDWHDLGAFLADDFQLGQRLQPVRIGTLTLETVASERTWPEALQHDLRWAKTIRWNRPGGFFARLLVLPVMGWATAVAMHPLHLFAWAGLAGMIQADVLAAVAICQRIGCRVKGRDLVTLECWSLWRIVAWILSWLPMPVMWSGRVWHGPTRKAEISLRTPFAEAIDNAGRKIDLVQNEGV